MSSHEHENIVEQVSNFLNRTERFKSYPVKLNVSTAKTLLMTLDELGTNDRQTGKDADEVFGGVTMGLEITPLEALAEKFSSVVHGDHSDEEVIGLDLNENDFTLINSELERYLYRCDIRINLSSRLPSFASVTENARSKAKVTVAVMDELNRQFSDASGIPISEKTQTFLKLKQSSY